MTEIGRLLAIGCLLALMLLVVWRLGPLSSREMDLIWFAKAVLGWGGTESIQDNRSRETSWVALVITQARACSAEL